MAELRWVIFKAVARKPRNLRELAADLPGDQWTVTDISAELLELRSAGYVRWQDGAWRVGPDSYRLGHVPVVVTADGGWSGGNALPGEVPGMFASAWDL